MKVINRKFNQNLCSDSVTDARSQMDKQLAIHAFCIAWWIIMNVLWHLIWIMIEQVCCSCNSRGLCSGNADFEDCPGCQLPWLRISVVCASPCKEIPWQYFKLGYGCFVPVLSISLAINLPTIWYCVVQPTGSIVK